MGNPKSLLRSCDSPIAPPPLVLLQLWGTRTGRQTQKAPWLVGMMPTSIFHKPDFKVKRCVTFPLKLSSSGMEAGILEVWNSFSSPAIWWCF